ncbi:hypothetical protein GCM10009416_45650 [Craurococcus roseus]|uniref:Uncharacterized protein n=1 Tax=Craurococcus roseus TaxID=77585 RepID=A0ABN1G2B7_9PROT
MGEGQSRLRRVRVERRGPAQGFQCRPCIAQRGERLAEVAQGDGVFRPASQRRPEEADGLPQLARFRQRAAVVGEEHGRFRLEGQRPARVPERRPRVAALPGHHAEQVVGVGVGRPGRGRLPVQALGAVEVAGLVAGHPVLQERPGIVLRHRRILDRRALRGNPPEPGRGCMLA